MNENRKDMKRFTIFKATVFCFFSSAIYRDVARYWKGVGFGYLLLLLILCWIPAMVKMHFGFSDFLKNDAPAVISQIPEIRIVDGKASTPENRPYLINDPETGEPFFLIDTTGETTSLDDAPESVRGLVTETGAIIEKSKFETRSFDFSEIDEFILTGKKIEGWAELVKKLLVPVVLPFAVMGSYVYRIIQALFYSLFGLVFAAVFGASGRMSYGAILRVTVLAMTPAILLKTLLGLFSITIPFFWVFYFGLSMAYLLFGIRSVAREQIEPPSSPLA